MHPMEENSLKTVANVYDFDGLRFYCQESKIVCLETNKEVCLRQSVNEFLLAMLERPGETITYGEFCNSVTAWTIYKDVSQVIRTIHVTKGELLKNLKVLRQDFNLLEAVPAKGYRIIGSVSQIFADTESLPAKEKHFKVKGINNQTDENISEEKFFGVHWRQIFFASANYAALYVVALFLEIAYEFEAFKNTAFKIAFPIFLWICLTSVAALFIGARYSKRSVLTGFISAATIFFCAALALNFSLAAFLPEYPLTKANFQTYPAQAAYLKNVFYFLGAGIFLIALPFVVTTWMENKLAENFREPVSMSRVRYRRLLMTNLVALSPVFLLAMTIIALCVSLVMTGHLLDNLQPHPNQNLFIELVIWRWFLYFALAAECLIWYRTKINSLRAKIILKR